MGSSNPADLVELFTMCFRICLAITLLAAAVAVLLFIRLDIKNAFLQMTGRKRKATIREINVAQEMTGKIGPAVPNLEFGTTGSTAGKSGSLKSGRTGRAGRTGRTGKTGRTGNTGSTPYQEARQTSPPPVQAAVKPPGKDTVPLVDDVEPKTEITSILYTGTGKQKSEKPVSAGFVVTKRIVVIHTDETIDQ